MRFRSNERGTRVKDRPKNGASKRAEMGGEERKETFLPLPVPPLSFFGSRFISHAAKTGLRLLRNQMETLASQAIQVSIDVFESSSLPSFVTDDSK